MDIHEMVRLKRLGKSHTEIGRLLGCARPTVVKYVKWAASEGLLSGGLPDAATLHARLGATMPEHLPPQQVSSLDAHAGEIRAMRTRGMEMAAIRVRLEERHSTAVSYEALRRVVRRQEPAEPEACVRVEATPGDEAQVDFGYAGLTVDPATGTQRKTWVFVIILSWSRHTYAELVYDQRVATWLLCHRHAFEFFGGVPARIVLDNLKAAIVKACRHEPAIQRAYRECAEHYGFLIDPNPPASPHLKGKVEKGGVGYVKRNFLAGRDPEPTDALNQKLTEWCLSTAGLRRHGTTQAVPLVRFRETEAAALLPLPRERYDLAEWKKVTLHRDCYATFDRAWYSAPYRLVGQELWARGGTRTVTLYTADHALVATHDRAAPGQRRTCLDHLPPCKVAGVTLTRATCREQAEAIGPATSQIVTTLLASRPTDKLRVAGRLVALAAIHGAARLEEACAAASSYGAPEYATVKAILQGERAQPPTPANPVPPGRLYTFARAAQEYVVALVGGAL